MIKIIRELFSLDEEKSSIVVWIFIFYSLSGMWMLYTDGDIPDNLYNLLVFLGGFVCTGSVATTFIKKGGNKNRSTNQEDNENKLP